ncbi:MAG TPA: hypothetical protein VFS43_08020 [Polyangiaceae bacterium]|nr:hypothetical protein [Polyangiaceae bacterium]
MPRFLRFALPCSLLLVGLPASAQEAPAPSAAPATAPNAAPTAAPPGGWVDPAPAPPERAPALIPPAPAPEPAPATPASAPPPGAPARGVPAGFVPRPAGFDSGLPQPPAAPSTRVFLGANVGWAGGRFTHPKLVGSGFSGPALGAHVGVSLTRAIAVGLDFTAYRTTIEHIGDGKYGYKADDNGRYVNGVRVTAGCQTCDRPQSGAGYPGEGPLNVLTLGPRLQFAPDPARGFFATVSTGVTFLEAIIANRTGAAFGARGGYRLGISEQVGVALEVGGTAHRFSGATSAFGFGGLQLQMRL